MIECPVKELWKDSNRSKNEEKRFRNSDGKPLKSIPIIFSVNQLEVVLLAIT